MLCYNIFTIFFMIIFRFLEKPMNLVHVLCFILIFQNVECQCTGGYTAVLGDILGWGSVNGFGAGQIVASCSECIALCDQQGPACLSTECSPSTLQCNLNAHSNVDTTTSFGDFSFCVKPTGNDFMILNACSTVVPSMSGDSIVGHTLRANI